MDFICTITHLPHPITIWIWIDTNRSIWFLSLALSFFYHQTIITHYWRRLKTEFHSVEGSFDDCASHTRVNQQGMRDGRNPASAYVWKMIQVRLHLWQGIGIPFCHCDEAATTRMIIRIRQSHSSETDAIISLSFVLGCQILLIKKENCTASYASVEVNWIITRIVQGCSTPSVRLSLEFN